MTRSVLPAEERSPRGAEEGRQSPRGEGRLADRETIRAPGGLGVWTNSVGFIFKVDYKSIKSAFGGVWTRSHGFLINFEYKASESGFGSVWTGSDLFLIKFEYKSIKSGFGGARTESVVFLFKV